MQLQQLLQDKRYLFWLLQLAGWSSWGFSYYLGILVWGDPPDNYFWYLPVVSGIGILITLVLRTAYRATWEKAIPVRAAVVVLGSYLAGATWMAIRASIFYSFWPEQLAARGKEHMPWYGYLDGTISAFWVMLAWSALYVGIKYYLLMQEEKQRSLAAMGMAHEAQLKMLRYQLNPHFLFNTLNAISTLILEQETRQANDMVTRLSRFLRYSLDNDPRLKVSVAEEIKALQLYLDIEQVRFGDRLRLYFDVAPDASDALMPSLLLQPLVENAVKYAIASSPGGGSIAVSARVFGNDLLLSVADDGPGLDLRNGRAPKGGGVGITNCRERLRTLYGDDQSFRLSATDPHGLTISIRLPLDKETAKP